MTDKVKELAPKIWQIMQGSANILMHCHLGPDADSYGSVLGVKHILESIGKKVTIISEEAEKLDYLSMMPGYDSIELKSYFDIDSKKFDLFIALDSPSTKRISRKGEIIFPEGMKVIVIDHHQPMSEFGDIYLNDTSYPATGQMLFDVFTSVGVDLDYESAICFFLGIYTDTGGFKYPPTNSSTLRAAADLIEICPDYQKYISFMDNSYTPGRFKYLGVAYSNIQSYFSDKVGLSVVSLDKLRDAKIDYKDVTTSEVATGLRSVKQWQISVSLIEVEKDRVELSFRCKDGEKFDLNKIAKEVGGGGGKASAGATILKPLNQAKEDVLNSIKKLHPELGTP